MKLEQVISKLKDLEKVAEEGEYDGDYIGKLVIQVLLDHIANPKIEEAVDDIFF